MTRIEVDTATRTAAGWPSASESIRFAAVQASDVSARMPHSAWSTEMGRNRAEAGGIGTQVEESDGASVNPTRWNHHAPADVLEYARLAEAAYQPTGAVEGWDRLGDRNVETRSGFKAALFRSRTTGQVVAAFAGTDFSLTRSGAKGTLHDVFTDVLQGFALPTQYLEANRFAHSVKGEFGDRVLLTGHSLGGGLAAWSSANSGLRAVTFNAAGLGLEARGRLWVTGMLKSSGERITNINVRGELLSSPPLAPTLGLAPAQLGTTIELAPANEASNILGNFGGFGPLSQALVDGANAVGHLPQRVTNHQIGAVIDAISLNLAQRTPRQRPDGR